MSSNDRLCSEFLNLRERIQSAINEFEAATGICVVDIKTIADAERFHSHTRPKAGKTRVTFIELGA